MSNDLKSQIESEEKETTLEFLTNFKSNIKKVSDYYREGNVQQGSLGIVDIIDDINIILSGADTLFLGAINVTDINSILEEVVLAMESGDNTLIADLLIYELEPIISKIEEGFYA